ncbi:hypothetical protein [Rhizobium tumorigenes]|uniref:Uncharacterized protein n=1 Tax=Rhizobium tumorigenes TaxID=2041385 RepID=A0AAF1K867_9HYPH|nr:hypothetical protein [Rhizobium tumorigenes]WFR97783.1 hypothetical protein PR017_17875 [Rhizobium tumorigenes]
MWTTFLCNVYPQVWEDRRGKFLEPGQMRGKGRSRFERDNAGRWVVISAIQPRHHPGFVECIVPLARRRSTEPFMPADEQRRYLVAETANMRTPQASLAGTGRQAPRQWRPPNRTSANSSRRSTEPWHAHDAGAGRFVSCRTPRVGSAIAGFSSLRLRTSRSSRADISAIAPRGDRRTHRGAVVSPGRQRAALTWALSSGDRQRRQAGSGTGPRIAAV